VLLVVAGLLVAFVAYQQWGTAFTHWEGQRSLRTQFDRSLAAVERTGGGTAVAFRYPAVGDPVGVLVIPRIDLDQVVVEGVQAAQLAVGPGHYPGTALPGQAGNAGIAGHRTTHGAPFYSLDRVRPGDPIVVTTVQGRFTYRVVRTLVVSPDDGAVLGPTASPQLTLTTCTPKYSAAQRLVVVADLESPPAPTTPPPGGTGQARLDDASPGARPWVVLAAAVAALVALVLVVGLVRRRGGGRPRGGGRRWARWAPWLALPVGVVLVLVAFGALDTLLPQGF
jgi:sortase A